VPLSDATRRALDRYIASEPDVLGVTLTTGPVFRNRNRPRHAMSAERIGDLITDALTRLGVKQAPGDGRSGDALRHTALTEALEGGARIEVVQRLAGHAHAGITGRPTSGAVLNDLARVHDMRAVLSQ
jgi:integrase